MVLPKRTPWATPAEFLTVFDCIYSSGGELKSQEFGIERIKVWMERGNCPHAVESTGNLLEIIVKDDLFSKTSNLQLRLTYSLVIIRFVNLLIDKLQVGYFARSMNQIAIQLGLPLYFIELRHAATHEDLPSLSVLRVAAHQALDWLYNNYWLTTLSPQSNELPPIEPLRAFLVSYKGLIKTSIRDLSQVSKLKGDLLKVYRGIEGWVQGVEKFVHGGGKERAIEGLIEAFLEVGGLVPTAKKKRCSTRSTELPAELIAIWTPLLSRMEDAYEGFHESLMNRMVEILSASETDGIDKSYILTIMAWIGHFLQLADDPIVSENVIKGCLLSSSPNTLSLLDLLSKSDPSLSEIIKPLMGVLRNSDTGISVALDEISAGQKLEEMEKRMLEMEAMLMEKPISKPKHQTNESSSGWKVVDDWKPCPFGMLPSGKLPKLDLV